MLSEHMLLEHNLLSKSHRSLLHLIKCITVRSTIYLIQCFVSSRFLVWVCSLWQLIMMRRATLVLIYLCIIQINSCVTEISGLQHMLLENTMTLFSLLAMSIHKKIDLALTAQLFKLLTKK